MMNESEICQPKHHSSSIREVVLTFLKVSWISSSESTTLSRSRTMASSTVLLQPQHWGVHGQ